MISGFPYLPQNRVTSVSSPYLQVGEVTNLWELLLSANVTDSAAIQLFALFVSPLTACLHNKWKQDTCVRMQGWVKSDVDGKLRKTII